ncbi:hypothetical protein MXB_140 [Myxobolus squamalis]|nr:hypothetical protein MXB_140 [Myxobolus squamalis]
MFVSEFRTVCLSGPLKSYINISDNKATEFSALGGLIHHIENGAKVNQLVSNQYKSAYIMN